MGISRELDLTTAKQIDMARLVTIDSDTPILLPPDLRNWLPPGHLVRLIINAIERNEVVRDTGFEPVTPTVSR